MDMKTQILTLHPACTVEEQTFYTFRMIIMIHRNRRPAKPFIVYDEVLLSCSCDAGKFKIYNMTYTCICFIRKMEREKKM